MDPSDVATLIILVILLCLSAFFSCSETALTVVSKMKIRSLAEEGNKKALTVNKLIEDPTKMLSAILICNNVVNLSASSISTSFAYRVCENYLGMAKSSSLAAGIATGILTILVLIFGEITPKSVATVHAEKLALAFCNTIYFITQLLTPFVFLVNAVSKGLLRIFKIDMATKGAQITENELMTIFDVSHEEGVIESEEHEMITNIVEFGDSLVKDVMVPRVDVEMISDDISYEELISSFSSHKFSRLPVYSENIDNIIGTINLKDIFFFHGSPEAFSVRDLVREPYITYEYRKTSELFVDMRKEYIAMAIVLDEYGGFSGIITLEDLIEEIVGEIRDEYDIGEEDSITKVSDDEYIVDGTTNLNEINDEIGLDIESNDYDSIGGHVINLLSDFPEKDEIAEDDFATYRVLEVDNRSIDKIYIKLKPRNFGNSDDDDE